MSTNKPLSNNLTPLSQPVADPSRGRGGGGNGNMTDHRLSELERRMDRAEDKLDDVREICIRIDSRMEHMASKADVYKLFGVTLLTLVASFLAIAFRSGVP